MKQFGNLGTIGHNDGDATTSRFSNVRGIAFSADATANSGYAYVAEYCNRRVRKLILPLTTAGVGVFSALYVEPGARSQARRRVKAE